MARGGKAKDAVGSALGDTEVRLVGAGLRAQLRQVGARIGMLDAAALLSPGNRFRAATLLSPNAPLPPALGHFFPEELAELGRLRKPTARCHLHAIGAYNIFALPYFFFDGFNALMAVEDSGGFLAAWQDSEANQSFVPKEMHVRREAGALERFLQQVLAAAA